MPSRRASTPGSRPRRWCSRAAHTKLALVAVDLFAAPGGLVEAAAAKAGHGFTEENVLVSASHTHSGPSGFANFSTLNTVAPSASTITDPSSFIGLLAPEPADPQLYTFLAERIALAIRRAERDRGPAEAAWGVTKLEGVTENRSLEAHLADHGIIEQFGQGDVSQDPDGYAHTIDPNVSMLRVDRIRGKRRIPLGGWSTFANHGTVNPAKFTLYNQDHHGTARRTLEARIRRAAHVPKRYAVIDVYGNSNEGDQSAGLHERGPSVAERVGRAEGEAMFKAWKKAGRAMSRNPRVDLRWTRVCFCGQTTADGRVSSLPLPGVPFFTGSEENRGPLFDITGIPFEGQRAVLEGYESQGHKIGIPGASKDTYPTAVPLFALRVGDRMIITMPGEATVEVGRRAIAAVLAASEGTGLKGAVVSGLTNEFIQYITTPEEYDRQHYEGGSTFFGPAESAALIEPLGELAAAIKSGGAAPGAYPFDATNGIEADAEPYGKGASAGSILTEPADVSPGAQAVLVWQGGPRGLDRPLDKRFIAIERRTPKGFRRVADDLGVAIAWTVDADGRHEMHWQVPTKAAPGAYRVQVTANAYNLTSAEFQVAPGAPGTAGDPNNPASPLRPPHQPLTRGENQSVERSWLPMAANSVQPTFREVLALAREQHGVVTAAQLAARGVSRAAIRHRIARRRLFEIHRGVLALGTPQLTRHGRWMAAVLACGDGALLSHRSAGALWGVSSIPTPGAIAVSVAYVAQPARCRESASIAASGPRLKTAQ